MKRHSTNLPKISLHKPSGNAQVWINSIPKHVYLGKYGTPESRRKYDRLMRKYFPSEAKPEKSVAEDLLELVEKGNEITVAELCISYVEWAEKNYHKNGKPTGELGNAKRIIRMLKSQYGHLPASEFGPLRYINRLLVIEFPNGRIKNGLPIDVDLEDRLIQQEHWGILLWAIEGWNRLRNRGKYIQPESAEHLIAEIQESSQPVKQFVEDKCFLKRGAYCLKHDLLQAYDSWRYTRNLPRCSMKTLTRELYAAFGSSIKPDRKLINEKRCQVFYGLDFIPQNRQDNGADLPASGRLNGRMPGQENKQFGWEKR